MQLSTVCFRSASDFRGISRFKPALTLHSDMRFCQRSRMFLEHSTFGLVQAPALDTFSTLAAHIFDMRVKAGMNLYLQHLSKNVSVLTRWDTTLRKLAFHPFNRDSPSRICLARSFGRGSGCEGNFSAVILPKRPDSVLSRSDRGYVVPGTQVQKSPNHGREAQRPSLTRQVLLHQLDKAISLSKYWSSLLQESVWLGVVFVGLSDRLQLHCTEFTGLCHSY